MDTKFVLVVLFAAFVAVSCKPTGVLNDGQYYSQMKRAMKHLSQQIDHVKDIVLKRQASDLADSKLQDATDLEDSLKQAIANDKQASKDETKAAKDALDSVQKVENEILMDYDFDEYDAAEKKAKKDIPKAGGPILASDTKDPARDEEIVKPQIMDPNDGIPNNDEVPAMGGPHMDRPLKEVFDEEVSGMLQSMRKDIKGIAADFKEVKRDYAIVSNLNRMNDATSDKFDLVKSDVKTVLKEFKDIRDEYSNRNAKREVHPESKDELKAMLSDMQDQLKSITANLKDVKDYAATMSMKKDENVDDEFEHMKALESEVRDILKNTKDIRADLVKAKDTPTKDEVSKSSSEKLEDLKAELDLVRDEIKTLRDTKKVL